MRKKDLNIALLVHTRFDPEQGHQIKTPGVSNSILALSIMLLNFFTQVLMSTLPILCTSPN